MKLSKTWVNLLRFTLCNAKWIMVIIQVLNLFVFGYWQRMYETGLGDEETFWGIMIILALILLFVFNKAWVRICNKICDYLE